MAVPEGRRFVITGLSRISVRVANQLHALGARCTVLADDDHDGRLVDAIADRATVVTAGGERAAALVAAGVHDADALLALSDDDLDNLRTVSCAAAVAPDVPVVVRSFDPAIADRMELGSNVRRAFSVSALAAPAFVAAALGDDVLQTLRLGRHEVPLLRLTIAGRLSPDVTVVARRGPDGWQPALGDAPAHDDEVVVAGRLLDLLRVALRNDPLPPPPPTRPGTDDPPEERNPRTVTSTLLPVAAVALVVLVLAGTIAFGIARDLGPIDALYFTLTTAWGDAGLAGEPAWQEAFGLVLMLGVGALVGVLFSHLAAVATAERLDQRMERRASSMAGHVVVAGLGTIGYRITRLLDELGVDVAVIENVAGSRFTTAGAAHAAVLVGDARLPEDLARASIERASCLIAVTDDDLVNISACLQAKAANPGIRTVARIFDETVADHAGPALGIDAVVSASLLAASAFVGAALDGRAPRRLALDGFELVAFRHEFDRLPDAATAAEWRGQGVHVVATDGTAAIVCGPADAPVVRELLRA